MRRLHLSLSEIDPRLGRELRRQLRALWEANGNNTDPETMAQYSSCAPEFVEAYRAARAALGPNPQSTLLAAAVVGSGVLSAVALVALAMAGRFTLWPLLVVLFLACAGGAACIDHPCGIRRLFRAEVLTPLAPLVARTPAERAYLEAVALLLSRPPSTCRRTRKVRAATTAARRDLLKAMNDLLACARRLTEVEAQLRTADTKGSLFELRSERDRLTRRRDGAADPATRMIREQALALCEARLRRAEALEPFAEWIAERQAAIVRAFEDVAALLAERASVATYGLPGAEWSLNRIRWQTQASVRAAQKVVIAASAAG
jgi:hypothetical protein